MQDMKPFIKKALSNDAKPALMAPFQVDGHLCASDGYRAHIVLDSAGNEPYAPSDIAGVVRNLLRSHDGAFGVQQSDLVMACKQAKALKPNGNSVLFYADGAKMCVQSQDRDTDTECVIEAAQLSPGHISVCLNIAFVLQALASFKDGPMLIKPCADGAVRFEQRDMVAIIMPLRGNDVDVRKHSLADAQMQITVTAKQRTAQRRNTKRTGTKMYNRTTKKTNVPAGVLQGLTGKVRETARKHAELIPFYAASKTMTGVLWQEYHYQYNYDYGRPNTLVIDEEYKVTMRRITNGRDVVNVIIKKEQD